MLRRRPLPGGICSSRTQYSHAKGIRGNATGLQIPQVIAGELLPRRATLNRKLALDFQCKSVR